MKTDAIHQKLAEHCQEIFFKNPPKENKSFGHIGLSAKLQPFTASKLGNFPYIWRSPIDLTFNQSLYSGISGC